MSLKEEFLKLKTFSEYNRNREKFKNLEEDADVIKHKKSLTKGIIEEYQFKNNS